MRRLLDRQQTAGAESDSCRLWLLALTIPQVVSKQLSAHILLTFMLRCVGFSDLGTCDYINELLSMSNKAVK